MAKKDDDKPKDETTGYEYNEVLTGREGKEAAEPTEEIIDGPETSASHVSNTYSDPLAFNDTPITELLPPADEGDKRAQAYKCNICGSALDVYRGTEQAHKMGTGFCEKCGERRLLQK